MLAAMPLPSPTITEQIWDQIYAEARAARTQDPALAGLIGPLALDHHNLADALAAILPHELSHSDNTIDMHRLFRSAYQQAPHLVEEAAYDLAAIIKRDPAPHGQPLIPFMFYKGFHAIQTHRVAHWLWNQGRKTMACYLQSLTSRRFAVDIHPAAKIGHGIMVDHAHGVVIGETCVIDNDVSLLHNVTLGGTGKINGDRHPKIRSGVMIGAGAKVLGNIEIGAGARIAAGSVVLQAVPPCVTVAGVPAKIIGQAGCENPAEEMNQTFPCEDFKI